ncbi:hypothetical protein BM49_2216 [Streptococcus pneumoniae]|nr:hypothetical protein BM49_2216 [Streptococcus pneumoniae]KGI34147.1 hypothetical protein X231_2216 [Streptococcus pneumoniae ECC_3510]
MLLKTLPFFLQNLWCIQRYLCHILAAVLNSVDAENENYHHL